MPSIKLKTKFWECEDPEEWRKRYIKVKDGHLMVFVTIIAGLLFGIPILSLITAGTMVIVNLIMTISHNQHNKKQVGKEKKEPGRYKVRPDGQLDLTMKVKIKEEKEDGTNSNHKANKEKQSKKGRSTLQKTQETNR